MNLEKIIKGIRTKVSVPKAYALIINFKTGTYLSVQVAYNLEDAFVLAKKELVRKLPTADHNDLSIAQFTAADLASLLTAYVDIPIERERIEKPQEPKPPEVRVPVLEEKHEVFNKLDVMNKIVREKDVKLYEENKLGFTDPEKAYLEDKLGYKKPNKK